MKPITTTVMILLVSFTMAIAQSESPYEVIRLNNNQPIITQQMFTNLGVSAEGENINGPSLIRIPNWISTANRADPTAQYYLYFAHHSDDYIRMAWAADIEGPWNLYQTGSGVSMGDRGVLDHGGSYIYLDNDISIEDNHLASPDVHVDNVNQRIIMYFHTGSSSYVDGEEVNKQLSYVSTSPYGLEFYDNIEPVFFGLSYFRVFEHGGEMYALDNGATIYRALDSSDPWTPPSGFDFTDYLWEKNPTNPFKNDILEIDGLSSSELRVRHTGVRVVGDELQIFYSRRGEEGERIQMSTIDMSVNDWEDWDSTYPPIELMAANPGWEGGQYELLNSETSSAPEDVNQMRDPYLFEDVDGKLYLVYTAQGEDALGIARIYETPTTDLTLSPTMDSHVRGGSSSSINYGTATELEIKQSTNENFFRKIYLKYDLSNVTEVEHAVIKLYTNSTDSRPVSVYETTNTWDESTITWDNAPTIGDVITTTQVGSNNQYYEWNITEYAKSKVGDNISLVFYMESINSSTMKFSSSEGANAPQLEMVTISATVPSAPTMLSSLLDDDEIELSWTDNASDESGYKIERKEGAGSFNEIADLGANSTTYTDAGLASSTTYTYRVLAYNGMGNSSYTNEASETTLATVNNYTFNPDEDAYIRGGSSANTNYGSDANLVVKQGSISNYFRKSLIKFDLSNETIGNVTEAKLRIYATKAESIDITAFELADNWSESTVTWNNAPSDGSFIDEVALSSDDVYYELDVTTYVTSQLAGDNIISIGLWDLDANNKTVEFNSKEAGSNLPELIIEATSNARFKEISSTEEDLHQISIYPNPLHNGVLSIDLPNNDDGGAIGITITNIQGKSIYQTQIQNNNNTIKIDTNPWLNKGLYLVTIKTENTMTQSKLIVE